MVNENQKNPLPISESIVKSLQNMGDELTNPDAPALTDEMRARTMEAAQLTLGEKEWDRDSEISGMDAIAEGLHLHYEETGDPEVGKALESMKPGHHEALVERLNQPPTKY